MKNRKTEKTQLLFKIKDFILGEIKNQERFNDAQKKTLGKYIKLFHSNLLTIKLAEPITLEFSVEDIDNLVKLNSKS
jgi:hypothetical protein